MIQTRRILINGFSAQSRRLYANLRSVNTINSPLLAKRSLRTTASNNFHPSLQNDKPQEPSTQHRASTDPHSHPLGPKDDNPYATGPTREKPFTEGHTVNKANETFSSGHMQRDSSKGVVGKVKDAFNQLVSPATDVQTENAAQGLRTHQYGKVSSNLQEKAKETADNVKESVGTLQEKAKESYETAKEKIKETLGMSQEKANEVKETAEKTLDSAKGDGQKTLKSAKDTLQGAAQNTQEKGQETLQGVQEKGQNFKEKGRETMKGAQEKGKDVLNTIDTTTKESKLNPSYKTGENTSEESHKREAKEDLANVKPLDRHPPKPTKEIKEIAHDVKEGTK
jgi:endonuclease III